MDKVVPVERQGTGGAAGRVGPSCYETTAAGRRVIVYDRIAPLSTKASGNRTTIDVVARNPGRRFRSDFEFNPLTPLPHSRPSQPIVIRPVPKPVRFKALRAFLRISVYSGRKILLRILRRSTEETEAADAKHLLQSLGGVWIKVGQLLSLRDDLLSIPMCRELSSLQHESSGFPPEVARDVIEQDLGGPVSRFFSDFDAMPFAAASVSQVHRATLLDGNQAVVIKVMRPDVIASFARDIRLLNTFVTILRFLGIGQRLNLDEGMDELRALMDEEANYSFEAVNLKRMRASLRRHDVVVPRVFYKYSRSRVLVMEEVPGVLMSNYIRERAQNPAAIRAWERENNIDPEIVGRSLMVSVLRQILEDNLFHGDLHPGNVMLLPDNQIGLIDFGSVGQLNNREWFLYRHALGSMARGDYDRAGDAMLMTAGAVSVVDSASLRRDMAATLRSWEVRSQFPHLSYAERSIAAMSAEIAQVMARYKVPLAWGLMRVGRTLSTVDASLQVLVPDSDFRKFYMAYYEDVQRRRRSIEGQRRQFGKLMGSVVGTAGDIQMLLGEGVRTQALRLRGMPNRLMRFRISVLRFVKRILWAMIGFEIFAYLAYEHLRSATPAEHEKHFSLFDFPLLHRLALIIVSGIPITRDMSWIATLIGLMVLLQLASMANRALHRPE
jgi:ubiquinone biosynthesis protein